MVAMETERPREVQTQISEPCVSLCITSAFLSSITSSTKRHRSSSEGLSCTVPDVHPNLYECAVKNPKGVHIDLTATLRASGEVRTCM